MAFKFGKTESVNFSTPQEMFQDNKMKNIIGLIDYQSKMIDNYMETIDKDGTINNKHVAFELPTGSGKTLIGLLIGEYHRRKFNRKALFLCPTKQLVVQVCQQAKDNYGIDAIPFEGKQADYSPSDKSDYILGRKLGVTTYSSFFATSEYFNGTDIIVFDDVHSSEQYIADNWSVNIKREEFETLYRELAEIVKDTPIGESIYSRMTASSPYESDIIDWCNMIPIPFVEDKLRDVENIINANVEGTDLNYSWGRIRDHLRECNIFVSWDSILIRPYIAPTRSFKPFENALQCIYMSATLGQSGELERITGVGKIKRLPIVNEWDKKAIGRKYFVFPDLSFETKMHNEIIQELHCLSKRSVVIVPTNREQEELSNIITSSLPKTKIYSAQDLIISKDIFKKQEDAMVIIANRFDGIDFPDDESRMLILQNLPKTTHLQEKFFYSRMAASILFSERIKTKIVQAVGRCTRNAKDYAVVCVLGNSVLNDLIDTNHLKEYKPELRAEIEFGVENSTDLTNIEEMSVNVKAFLTRDSSWSEAEEYIVNRRDYYIAEEANNQNNDLFEKLKKAAMKEVQVQYELWVKDYNKAFNTISEIISILNAPKLKGYCAFWQYYAGHVALKLGEKFNHKAAELFENASRNVIGITWLAKLTEANYEATDSCEIQYGLDSIIERLEKKISSIKTYTKLEKKIIEITNGLTNAKGEAFETAYEELGKILGYDAFNPKGSGDPDPYWIIDDEICIVSEDKIYENVDKAIPLDHISQANRHKTWVKEKITTLHRDAKIYTVFISNSKSIEKEGRIHAKNIYYCNKNDLVNWANKALKVIRDCYNNFSNEGDYEWREYAKEEIIKNGVTPKDYIALITKTKLSEI